MNAATVSGPRSRTRSVIGDSGFGIRDSLGMWASLGLRDSLGIRDSLGSRDSLRRSPPFSTNPKSRIRIPIDVSVFLDRDEHLAVAAPHAQLRQAARLNLAELARRVGGVRHLLAVDRQDHV